MTIALRARLSTLIRIKEAHDVMLVNEALAKDSAGHKEIVALDSNLFGTPMMIDIERLWKWARSLKDEHGDEMVVVEESSATYSIWQYGANYYRDHEMPHLLSFSLVTSRLRLNPHKGIWSGDVFTLQVEDGEILPPPMPDKQDVQTNKRLLALTRKEEGLVKKWRKALNELESEQLELTKHQAEYEEAVRMVSKPVMMDEMVARARLVQECRGMFRHLETVMESYAITSEHDECESPPLIPDDLMEDERMVSWFTSEDRKDYQQAYVRYLETYNKLLAYKPKKSWGSATINQREKRRYNINSAKSTLSRILEAALKRYVESIVGLNRYDLMYKYQHTSYQHYRKVVRHWQRVKRELDNMIAEMQQTVDELGAQLTEVRKEKTNIEQRKQPITDREEADDNKLLAATDNEPDCLSSSR